MTDVDPAEYRSGASGQPTVYLAGPILHTDDGGRSWREKFIDHYGDRLSYFNPLDVFDGSEYDATIRPRKHLQGYEPEADEVVISDEELVETDKALVEAADALLIGYNEPTPSWGTPMEQAHVWNGNPSMRLQGGGPWKPVAVWHGRMDWRELSPWLRYHATFYSDAMSACVRYLEAATTAVPLCAACRRGRGMRIDGVRFRGTDVTCEGCGAPNALEPVEGI